MNKKADKKTIVIATGGTGGHIFPAKAFAAFLKQHNYDVYLVADEKYEKYTSPKDKFEHKIIATGKSLKSIKSLFGIFKGFIQSYFFIKDVEPDVVLGFGGYASLPTLLAAKFLKKKIVLHEENAYIGKINKFFAKDAEIIATSYRELYGIKYDDMEKIRFTGIPIRKEIKELAKKPYKLAKEKFNILILGGSGGAKFFGSNLLKSFSELDDDRRKHLHINHQCREENIEDAEKIYKENSIKHELKPFFNDMDKKLADANLVIARAGASSIAEFTAAGKPMILIPFPLSANGHQLKNAKSLESKHAAILIEQKDFNEKKFVKLISELIDNPKKLETLSLKSRNQSILNAEDKLLDVVEEVLNDN